MAKTVAKKAPAKTVAKKAPAAKAAPKAAPKAVKKAPARAAKPAAPAPKKITVTAAKGKTITQAALLRVIAEHNDMAPKAAKAFVESYTNIVKEHVLKGVKVKLGDLGTVMLRERKARMGRNPQTGAPVKIKASKKIAFRQSTTMRDTLNPAKK
ncbi:MAG: HU family DNA-binding protein [Alphaproteobacteria bacterium]|nr:HU family DNA-binding protein [Alphaproteobacteria bacterium]